MSQNKSSFILYSNYYDILKNLADQDLGMLFRAVLKYEAEGIQLEMPSSVGMAFAFIKNQLDIDKQKYNEKVEKLKINGKKGGLSKAKKSNDDSDVLANVAIAKIAKHNVNVNENVNVNVNDNVNVNENVNVNDNLSLLNEREENFETREGEISSKEEIETRDEKIHSYKEIETIEEKIDSSKEDDGDENSARRSIRLSKADLLDSKKDDEDEISDREILGKYVRKNKFEVKNLQGYINKIIENGDDKRIIEDYRARHPSKKRLKEIIQEEIASVRDKRSAARALCKYFATGGIPPDEFNEIMQKYNLDTYDKMVEYQHELEVARRFSANT